MVELRIIGDEKEIAALVLALQERHRVLSFSIQEPQEDLKDQIINQIATDLSEGVEQWHV